MSIPMNEDYFIQRPHHNFFNRIYYSNFMKRYNPFHEWRSAHPFYHVKLANWYGTPPHATWVDGSIDYTYKKYNRQTIGHFDMHENRKNKPYREIVNGGDQLPPFASAPRTPTYAYHYYPKGCVREIQTYKKCVNNTRDKDKCFNEKINIMEICPKWVLEDLREKKRFLLRATLIDNETYRRAMKVSDYNYNRSLKDIKEDIRGQPHIRADSYHFDDRYNPTVYPSPDHNTNVNLGDIDYNDVIGGNIVEKINRRRTHYATTNYNILKNEKESGAPK